MKFTLVWLVYTEFTLVWLVYTEYTLVWLVYTGAASGAPTKMRVNIYKFATFHAFAMTTVDGEADRAAGRISGVFLYSILAIISGFAL